MLVPDISPDGMPERNLPLVVQKLADLRAQLAECRSVGLVPTMGYLHQGHAALIRQACQQNELVVVSIFVNPTQFGPSEDLANYPRDLAADQRLIAAEGAKLLFVPSVAEMYPAGFSSSVQVTGLTQVLEGQMRPTHFAGVTTVVAKLLNIVQPQRAYFGEKDWQQLAVVRRMVSDLNIPVQIVGVPIQRAASGLALSSRNSYFSAEQLSRASIVSQSLRAVQSAYSSGVRQVGELLAVGRDCLSREAAAKLDYLHLIDSDLCLLPSDLNLAVDTAASTPPNVIKQEGVNSKAFLIDTNGSATNNGDKCNNAIGSVDGAVGSAVDASGAALEVESDSVGALGASSASQINRINNMHPRIVIAARLFGVRLIDNMPLVPTTDNIANAVNAINTHSSAGGTA